ncbi:MAG: hypothetical protein KL801_11515 [Mesorhizobium sp.]|nr:hypothetical protein [Mesorhizobium sp.]
MDMHARTRCKQTLSVTHKMLDALHYEDGGGQEAGVFSFRRGFVVSPKSIIGTDGYVDHVGRQYHAAAACTQIVDQLQPTPAGEDRKAVFRALDEVGNIGDGALKTSKSCGARLSSTNAFRDYWRQTTQTVSVPGSSSTYPTPAAIMQPGWPETGRAKANMDCVIELPLVTAIDRLAD